MSMNDATPTFDAEEHALLDAARRESEEEDQIAAEEAHAEEVAAAAASESRAAPAAPAQSPTAPEAQAAAPAATPAAPAAPAAAPATPATTPAPEPPGGSLRAALRASRHAESTLKEQLAAVQAENQRLKATSTTAQGTEKVSMSEADIEELRSYDPKAADKVERLQRERDEALTRAQEAAAAAPAPAEAFVPEVLPPQFQAVVDEMPELLGWQIDPNKQHLYEAAGEMNAYLLKQEKWAKASIAERFAEVVRRVNTDHGIASEPPPPREDPTAKAKAIIAAAPVGQRPVQVGAFRGGESATPTLPDYSKMSDEDVMASLPHLP